MTCKIVGMRRMEFKGQGGDDVKGYNVYVEHDEDGVDGVMAEKFFLSDKKLGDQTPGWTPKPGDKFKGSFNRYGKLDDIAVVK